MSIKVRHSSLFDLDSIAPLGSRTWAEESRQSIADALDNAIDGKFKFNNALRYFWEYEGWKLLEDKDGKPFTSMRDFALAKRPHGASMTIFQFRAFRKDVYKETEEIGEYAEVHPLPENGEVGRRHDSFDHIKAVQGGTSADYLARRIARDRPDVLERMKTGAYKSVRAAAKDAGIVREKTPLEQLRHWWKKACEEERRIFLDTIQDKLKGDGND